MPAPVSGACRLRFGSRRHSAMAGAARRPAGIRAGAERGELWPGGRSAGRIPDTLARRRDLDPPVTTMAPGAPMPGRGPPAT
ncbi:hypothetical protein LNKW23_48880 [Paralimibaculum aggregatum]|uniref:Uncharacterized protein n=1 Tax=Paralimibaculum aggregatum TaxID=3036245 RepID=A0ABQ6LUA4_9RHOB|nr:hypothetical protein LNKW23_48880 [Limibaculum sp. NKW23]